MTEPERIRQLITEAGPLDDDILQVLQTADDRWVVRFEHVDVDLEFDGEGGRLMLSADIGVPPADRRLAVYEALLLYSTMWRETGGVRMALAGAEGPAIQMVDLGTADLTPTTLATVLTNLADRTLVWRVFVASEAAGDAPFDPLALGAIRV